MHDIEFPSSTITQPLAAATDKSGPSAGGQKIEPNLKGARQGDDHPSCIPCPPSAAHQNVMNDIRSKVSRFPLDGPRFATLRGLLASLELFAKRGEALACDIGRTIDEASLLVKNDQSDEAIEVLRAQLPRPTVHRS